MSTIESTDDELAQIPEDWPVEELPSPTNSADSKPPFHLELTATHDLDQDQSMGTEHKSTFGESKGMLSASWRGRHKGGMSYVDHNTETTAWKRPPTSYGASIHRTTGDSGFIEIIQHLLPLFLDVLDLTKGIEDTPEAIRRVNKKSQGV